MAESVSPQTRVRRRFPLLIAAVAALIAGLWTGLVRIGWVGLHRPPLTPISHGPLMIGGFLGTLISLERAVALGSRWAFTGPILTGIGAVFLLALPMSPAGALLMTAGSGVLVAIFGAVSVRGRPVFLYVMALGAVCWLIGNLHWLFGASLYEVAPWWAAFLVLTIAGERLELSRVLLYAPAAQQVFLGAVFVFLCGVLVFLVRPDAGHRVAGIGLSLLAVWLGYYDVARYTIRRHGLTRFIAVSLLSGYVWLFAGGIIAASVAWAPAGPLYDATWHAVFVGFVFSMIFGHAPIIFPSILGVSVFYRPRFYVHLGLLHLSLLLRIVGDLAGLAGLRRFGGLLNAAAVLLFLGSTAAAVLSTVRADRLANSG